MKQTPSTCRVVIVDDDWNEIVRIRGHLTTAVSQMSLDVEIDSRLEADPVTKAIRETPNDALPPWDLILADVVMGDRYGGAYKIACAIKERYPQGEVPVKLAAITSHPDEAMASDLFEPFTAPDDRAWFYFQIKGDPASYPKSPFYESAWQDVLLRLVADRSKQVWGWRGFNSLEHDDDKDLAFFSPPSALLLDAIAKRGANTKLRHIHLVTETGSGKRAAANLLHAFRMDALEQLTVGFKRGSFVRRRRRD